jgi:hypothetical protein
MSARTPLRDGGPFCEMPSGRLTGSVLFMTVILDIESSESTRLLGLSIPIGIL